MKHLLSLLLTLFPLLLQAQFLFISEIDQTNYPLLKAKITSIDAKGNSLINYNKNDISLFMDGEKTEIDSIICYENLNPEPVSVLLVLDISGSMYGENIEIAKRSADAFIKLTPFERAECAIISFDDNVYPVCDFSRNATRLRSFVQNLQPSGGTDYNSAFLDLQAGILSTLKNAAYRKVVIFLSDGLCTADDQLISKLAQEQNTTVFSVMVGMNAPDELKNISTSTGGQYFENVKTIQEAVYIYSFIQQIILVPNYCNIFWKTNYQCEEKQIVEIDLFGMRAASTIRLSEQNILGLKIEPDYLVFGGTTPGDTIRRSFSVEAFGKPMDINLDCTIPNIFSFASGITTAHLEPNEPMKFDMIFSPLDSGFIESRITINSQYCSDRNIFAYGGFNNKRSAYAISPITVKYPNGGEMLPARVDTAIAWRGVDKNDWVKLQYSDNNGATWFDVGFARYNDTVWTAPAPVGNNYLAKAILLPPISNKLVTPLPWFINYSDEFFTKNSGELLIIEGNFLLLAPLSGAVPASTDMSLNKISCTAFSPDGTMLAAGSRDGNIIVWDTKTRMKRKEMEIRVGINDLVFSNNSQLLLSANRRHAYIWDPIKGEKVKKLRNNANIVFAAFSPRTDKPITATNNEITIWNTTNYKEDFVFKGRLPKINSAKNLIVYVSGKSIIGIDADSYQTQFTFTHKDGISNYNISENGQRLVSVTSKNEITVWDLNTKSIFRSFEPTRTKISAVALNNSGSRMLFGDEASRVGLYDLDINDFIWDYSLYDSLNRKNYKIKHLSASPDGAYYYVYGEKYLGLLLTNFNEDVMPFDISDNKFSVVKELPQVIDVEIPTVFEGQIIEHLVPDFFTNNSNIPVAVDNIIFSGTNKDAFGIVSSVPPFTLQPGEKKRIEIAFYPKYAGSYSAQALIISAGDTVISNITANAVKLNFRIGNNIDFGTIKLGESKEMRFPVITNIGETPLFVDKISLKDVTIDQFELEGTLNDIILDPNATLVLNGRYNAKYRGKGSASVEIFIADSKYSLRMMGTGFGAREVTLSGRTVNKDNVGIKDITITITDVESGRVIQTLTTNSTGAYSVQLPSDRNYIVTYEKDGFLKMQTNIDLTEGVVNSTMRRDIVMPKHEVGAKLMIGDVLFETDKANLNENAYLTLQNIVNILKENPTMEIEIGGHTDNVGTDEHNQSLSERRANSVYTYLKINGIETSRIKTKGYGSKLPIADNSTEEGKQKNRRIEITILKL